MRINRSILASVILGLLIFRYDGYSQTNPCTAVTMPFEMPQVGANLDGVRAESPAGAFMDMVNQSYPFERAGVPGPMNIDSEGWPLNDFKVFFQLVNDGEDRIYNGTYKLSFKGKADINIDIWGSSYFSNYNYDLVSNTTTADLNMVIFNAVTMFWGLQFLNTQRSPSDPIGSGITNLKLIRPTSATLGGISWGSDPNATFTQPFLDNLKRYKNIRFMDWLDTNNEFANGYSVTNWADRKKVSDPHQAGKVAWEYCIELVNLLEKDMWINIPLGATPDYVTSLATLLKNTVKPGIHIYFEVSNELWNWSNSQSHVNDSLALAEVNAGGSILCLGCEKATEGSGWYAGRRILKLTREFSRYFRSVYGDADINTSIRPVFCTQAGWPGLWLDPPLDWYEQAYGVNSLKDDLYGIAYAPYFRLSNDFNGMTKDDVLDQLTADMMNWTSSDVIGHGAAKARWNNVKFLAYEGGPEIYGANNMDAKIAAQFDPRMKDLVYTYLQRWFSYGSEGVFNWFVGTPGVYGPYGQYGVSNDITITNPAKTQGIDSIMKTPMKVTAGFTSSTLINAVQYLDNANWQAEYDVQHQYGGSYKDYLIRVDTAGVYAFAVSIMSEWWDPSFVQRKILKVMIDNEFVDTIAPRPTEYAVYDNYKWTDEVPEDSIKYFLTPGLHVLRLVCDYTSERPGFIYRQLKFNLIKDDNSIPLQPGAISASKNPVCPNTNNITYSVPLVKGMSYEWSYTGSGISPLTSTTNSITINFSTNATSGKLSVVAKNICGIKSPTSSDFAITINAVPDQPSVIIGSQSVCNGQSSNFSIAALQGSNTYTWSYVPATGVTIHNNDSTDISIDFASSAQSGTLNVFATNTCGTGSMQTKPISLDTPPNAGLLSVPNNIIITGNSTEITAKNISGNIVNWQFSTDGIQYKDTSVTSTLLGTGILNIPGTYFFRLVVTNESCPAVTGTPIKITVVKPTAAGIANISAQEICSGENITLTLTGYDGSITWQDSLKGGIFKSIPGANTSSQSINSIAQNTWYRAMVEGTSGTTYSNIVNVTVSPQTIAGIALAVQSTVVKGTGTSINLTDYVGTIQWESSLDSINFQPLPTEINSTLNTGPLNESTYFHAVLKSGSCSSTISNIVKVAVDDPVKGGIAVALESSVCQGSGTTLSLQNYNGAIQWERSDDGISFIPLVNQNSDQLILTSLNTDSYFRAKVTKLGASEFSNVILVSVEKTPTTDLPLTGSTVCFQTSGAITLHQSQNGIIYQAYINGSAVGSSVIGTGGDLNFSIPNTMLSLPKTIVTVKANSITCKKEVVVNTAEIIQQSKIPKPGPISGVNEVCILDQAVYSINPLAGDYIYVWKTPSGAVSQSTDGAINKVTFKENLGTGSVISVATKSGECLSDTSSIEIKMKASCLDVFVPNIITPNSSDNNSTWTIKGLQAYPEAKVKVLNRWGSKVYESEVGYPKAWNGISDNGEHLPSATYYYIIELKNKAKALTGSVTVMQ